ncbi:MAG: hypothetical protein ACKVY0_28585 [Prosthecobacter sp.]|uniref:hypothetical protein n=1 Tax=Prosthecobacter sp. TaxID=1965333 RepID=UPI003901F9EE
MSEITIPESGMSFGPFGEAECFRIETSETYKAIQEGVMMAEFLLIRDSQGKRQVWIVEAKKSSPQKVADPQRFDEFIGELRDKLLNGLSLGLASMLGRHLAAENELPQAFRDLDLKLAEFRLIVVINGHRDEWLPPLDDALKIALHSTIKTWALGANSVAVLNDKMARKHGLIADM